jgi:hypothetical protein
MIPIYFSDGLCINEKTFLPQNLFDLKLCFLYIFLAQHGILIFPFTKPFDSKLSSIILTFLQKIHADKSVVFIFLNFFKQKDLHLKITYENMRNENKNIINMKDIYKLFGYTITNISLLEY